MQSDDNARLIYGFIVVMLLVGSLAARRLPMKQYLKMILAWVAIFAAVFVVEEPARDAESHITPTAGVLPQCRRKKPGPAPRVTSRSAVWRARGGTSMSSLGRSLLGFTTLLLE